MDRYLIGRPIHTNDLLLRPRDLPAPLRVTAEELRAQFENLRQWKADGKRAPHKPLLLLYALARFAEGVERFPYNTVEAPLLGLLDDFGPSRRRHQAFPFWRLTSDGIWAIDGAEEIRRSASGDMRVSDARALNPVARFPDAVADALRATPGLISELVQSLLDAHFPSTLHEDILSSIGFDPGDPEPTTSLRRTPRYRDPAFRVNVIRAYEYRCAVCGFETRIGNTLVGVDAAHVKWHQTGSADVDAVSNGVALCALHHRLLDRGAFTLAKTSYTETVVEVAEDAHGGDGFRRWLLDFHGRPIAEPVRTEYRVSEPSLAWHRREVFRGPSRN